MILVLTNCGFNLELETNCGTFQFMTSAVRYHPTRQKVFPHSMPWQDQITHPSFLARNLLTRNGARGQSSQPRFVIWWISQKHLLQMASLSSRASSSQCIRFFFCTLTDDNQARQQIFAQSFRTFEYLPPTKAALVEQVLKGVTR